MSDSFISGIRDSVISLKTKMQFRYQTRNIQDYYINFSRVICLYRLYIFKFSLPILSNIDKWLNYYTTIE